MKWLKRFFTLASLLPAVRELCEAGAEYQRECESPVPDVLLKKVRRDQLFAALSRVRAALPKEDK